MALWQAFCRAFSSEAAVELDTDPCRLEMQSMVEPRSEIMTPEVERLVSWQPQWSASTKMVSASWVLSLMPRPRQSSRSRVVCRYTSTRFSDFQCAAPESGTCPRWRGCP